MDKARDSAAKILLKIELDGAYSSLTLNDVLRRQDGNEKDNALITSLVYGVCERKFTLDYNIALYLKSPLKKLHPSVLTYLRLGAWQILFADRIPDRAAINESVELAKKNKVAYAAGLINAVLRRISTEGLVLPDENETVKYLSVKYSCPEELLTYFISSYGIMNTKGILEASVDRRPVFIRANTLKCSENDLLSSLNAVGVKTWPTPIDGCYSIDNTGDITSLKEYRKGYFFVQDMSSQTACKILGAEPGETLVDCCAAPGGKTFSSAIRMLDRGTIFSCDIYPHKTELIEKGAQRLGLHCVKTVCCDALLLKHNIHNADRVLCDVPCSGFGVIGRKPEIKYRSLEEIADLPAIQLKILESCSEMVRPGGVLVYSTCTLNPAENDGVCDSFLEKHPEFSLCCDGVYAELRGENKYVTTFPTAEGGDGFFTAKFIRSGS